MNQSIPLITNSMRQSFDSRKILVSSSAKTAIIDPVMDPRWDAFIEKHPYGWVCHLSAWKQVIEQTFPHMKGHYLGLVAKEGAEILAALPVFEINSWLTGRRLVSIPFATLSDPLVTSAEQMQLLLNAAMDLAAKLQASSVEIRTLNAGSLIRSDKFCPKDDYKNHYILLDANPEVIKRRFHQSSVRRCIHRALRSNFAVEISERSDDLANFYRLFSPNRKRLGLPVQPFSYFENLWEAFVTSKTLLFLTLRCGGQLAAGLILFRFKSRCSAEFIAVDKSYSDLNPAHLLYWEAIKLAYQDGYSVFDFGRTSVHNAGLMSFKNRWGTQLKDLTTFYYPKAVFEQSCSRESRSSYCLMRHIIRKSPAAVARRISAFCYRHIG